MGHTKDFIPRSDAEFDPWYKNLKNYVYSKTSGASPAWTHIPAAKVIDLINFYADWNINFEKCKGPHTSVDVVVKNESRKAAEALIRAVVKQYLMFEPVSNADRAAMNLHNPDPTRSEIGAPQSRVIITKLRAIGGFRAEVWFRDEFEEESHAIPYGMNGCLLIYCISDEKVTDYSLLTEDVLMTASPFVLPLPPTAEGKFLSVACIWQNNKGQRGPVSEIMHLAIS